MEDLPAEVDELTRFATLREESLQLLDDARDLVGQMRSALDHCKRHRPAVETFPDAVGGPVFPPVKTHRGGRVGKKHIRRLPRRPR